MHERSQVPSPWSVRDLGRNERGSYDGPWTNFGLRTALKPGMSVANDASS